MRNKKQEQNHNSLWMALAGGLAGACALTLVHETVRRLNPDAPRMDVLGMRALAKTIRAAGHEPPAEDKLFGWTMLGDIVSNALYYSLTGTGKGVWLKGPALGLAAGVGGVMLPGPLGLGEGPSNRTTQTKVMTVAWYLLGGIAAAAATHCLTSLADRKE
ncbi:hypothetical protein [Adhaeribacter soli]|uniref:DUF1440 domain-containing protein n=1 Tax=Adhaeribacter soli TaxID=2607655 RepID=A0A5N1IR38_9BACT|nr:hypothetical protein [Adhaeribacter soli]KAA9331995.1 hypothetical protein F0P94_14475 [Adhaeribacter soli]